MKTATNRPEIEKALNKKLKWMGFLLFAFAAIAVIWDFFPAAEDEFDEILLEIEETPPPINSYLVSSSFALVGSCCLLIYWKKKASLSDNLNP